MESFMTSDFSIERIELALLVRAGTGRSVHRNRPSHGLALFLGGDRTLVFAQKRLHVVGGELVYFPRGSDYEVREKESSDCYAINFQLPEGVCFEPFSVHVKNLAAMTEAFRCARSAWENRDGGFSLRVKGELYRILSQLQTEYHLPYANASVIRPAVEYIHAHYREEPISVEALARLCGVSTVHLRKSFHKAFARSPIRYVNDLKMARAEELLSSRLHTVSEVCRLSGFQDESYFCRMFQRYYHTSPRAYRRGR